ncbi:MAG: hypothetical protein NTW33_09275 [Methanoregula sp.]|nr:hypothetical protein [Methanoregula sp.]
MRGFRGLTLTTIDGKFGFLIGEDERLIELLRQAYGTKVHLPFGYVSSIGVRIKYF